MSDVAADLQDRRPDHPAAPYRSVACLVDTVDTVLARTLVSHAVRLCGTDESARLSVIHVDAWLPPLRSRQSIWQLDRPHLMNQVSEWLDELCADTPNAEPVLLSSVDPPARAADWALDEGADLVVVAAHNRLFAPARMGSFASALAALSPAPVLVVSNQVSSRGEESTAGLPTRIACCLDESDAAHGALEEAVRLRDEIPSAQLALVHGVVHSRLLRLLGLWRILPSPRWRERPIVARLAATANQVPRATFRVVDGRPRDISTWAAKHGVELLVAGAGQNPSGIRFPGSFAHEVTVHAECPVLLVPPRGTSDREETAASAGTSPESVDRSSRGDS